MKYIKRGIAVFIFCTTLFSGQYVLAGSPSVHQEVELTIEMKGLTKAPNGIDNTTGSESDTFILPEKDGKITAEGHYTHHGSMGGGYVLSGLSYRYGYIKNNELILTAGEWFFAGESMKRTEMKPQVHIPLKNGAEVTYDFHYSQSGAHCDSTGIFSLEFKNKEK